MSRKHITNWLRARALLRALYYASLLHSMSIGMYYYTCNSKKKKKKKNICNNISNNMEGYMYATTISPLNSFMIKVTFASIYCSHQGLRKSRSEKQVLHTVDFFFFSVVVLFSSFVCLDLCSFFQQGKSVLQIETSFWSVLPNSISSMLSHQVFQGKGVATTKGCPPVLPKNNSGTEEINWSTTL